MTLTLETRPWVSMQTFAGIVAGMKSPVWTVVVIEPSSPFVRLTAPGGTVTGAVGAFGAGGGLTAVVVVGAGTVAVIFGSFGAGTVALPAAEPEPVEGTGAFAATFSLEPVPEPTAGAIGVTGFSGTEGESFTCVRGVAVRRSGTTERRDRKSVVEGTRAEL